MLYISNTFIIKYMYTANYMQYAKYQADTKSNLPEALENGTVLHTVERVEKNTFTLSGKETQGMRIFADGKEYRTSSVVLMDQFEKFFKANPTDVLENVKVVAPRGKKYLVLESSV